MKCSGKNETHFIKLALYFSVHKNPGQGPKSWADTWPYFIINSGWYKWVCNICSKLQLQSKLLLKGS